MCTLDARLGDDILVTPLHHQTDSTPHIWYLEIFPHPGHAPHTQTGLMYTEITWLRGVIWSLLAWAPPWVLICCSYLWSPLLAGLEAGLRNARCVPIIMLDSLLQ